MSCAFEITANLQTSSVERALVHEDRLKTMKTTSHITSHRIFTMILGGIGELRQSQSLPHNMVISTHWDWDLSLCLTPKPWLSPRVFDGALKNQ